MPCYLFVFQIFILYFQDSIVCFLCHSFSSYNHFCGMVSMRYFNDIPMQKTNYYKHSISDFSLDAVFVWGLYDEDTQRKIRRYKFVHNPVDSVYFESIFRELIEEIGIKNWENTSIIFPPISLKDRIFRWPNHAKKLARIFASCVHSTNILCPFYKNFFAGHQSRRNKQEREKILSEYRPNLSYTERLSGKKVILVDDVISTGYTAHILWKILKENFWAQSVVGVFLASKKT